MISRVLAVAMTAAGMTVNAHADLKITSRMSLPGMQGTEMQGREMQTTTYIKGSKQRIETTMNGMVMTAVISDCESGKTVMLMPMQHAYMVQGQGGAKPSTSAPDGVAKSGSASASVNVKPMNESKQIAGYAAKHASVEIKTSGTNGCGENSDVQIDGWYAQLPEKPACFKPGWANRMAGERSGRCKIDFNESDLKPMLQLGYPMEQTVSFDGDGGEGGSMTIAVESVETTTLDPALFEVPRDYHQVKTMGGFTGSGSGRPPMPE